MIIDGVIISNKKNKNMIGKGLKIVKKAFGLSNVKKASGLSNVKKASRLSNVKKYGGGLKILK